VSDTVLVELLQCYCTNTDHLTNLVRRVRGNIFSAMKDKDAERPPRPRRHRQCQAEPELEVDDEEPLDLEPL
jgi:hypothetical protein